MKKIICALALLTASLQAAAPQYTVSGVSFGLGGITTLYGINNKGEITGNIVSYTIPGVSSQIHPFLISSFTGQTLLPEVTGNTASPTIYGYSYGLNDNGSVVGWATGGPSTQAYGASIPYVYSNGVSSGIPINFNSTPLYRGGYAYAINNSGQVVGTESGDYVTSTASPGLQPDVRSFVYENGQLSYLPLRLALGNNNAGIVVGEQTVGGERRAAIYDHGNLTILNTLGGSFGQALDINDSGQVVGVSTNASGQERAFIYSNGRLTNLGVLAGANDSRALSINSSGQVFGISGGKYFVYSEGKLIDLSIYGLINNTILFGSGAQPGNYINDFGQIVLPYVSAPFGMLLNPTKPIRQDSGNSVNAKVVSGMAFSEAGPQTGTGGLTTNVSIVGGTASANRDVTTTIDNTIHLNLASDVVNVSGTGSDTFVLQLSYNEATAISLLGAEDKARLLWFNTVSGQWVNAVDGNTGGSSFFAGDGAYDALTDFQLGTYGVDTTNNTVWAVINHNSDFGAGSVTPVPEPSTWAIFTVFGGMAGIVFLRSRHKVR